MDKFSKILKDAVEGYEAPFNPQAWESISNQLGNELDPFEQSMKDAADKFKAPPADAAIWSAISSQLGNTLSPFEEAMKDSVDQFQPPAADPMVWENISSELGNSAFEESIKESVEGYEAPYSASVWEAIVAQLGTSNTWKWVAGSAAALILLIGGFYFLPTDKNESADSNDKEVVSNELAENNENEATINSDNTTLAGNIDNDQEVNEGQDILDEENPLNPIDHHIANNIPEIPENGSEFENNSNDHSGNGTGTAVVDNNQEDSGNTGNENGTNTTEETKTYIADIKCDVEACQGSEMTFIADQTEEDCDYVWQFGDGTKAVGKSVTHIYYEEGEFDVTLNVVKGLDVLATDERGIVVHRIPIPEFTVENPNAAIPSYKFVNETDAGTNISWEVDGMGQTNRSEFEMTFRERGTYVAKLTATNEYGCSNSRKEIIEIDNDYNLLAQNTLVLDDVDERRRTFMPPALTILDQEFVMTIYSKDGGMVYQTRDANSGWDGRYSSDNRMANPGTTFVWIVQLKNANGEMETYKGTFTVL